MSDDALFKSKQTSTSVRATTQPVSVVSFYSCQLRYFYHCIHHTTLGPQLLAAALDDEMIQLLRRTAAFQSSYKHVLALALIAVAVFACLGVSETVPFQLGLAVCILIAVIFLVLLIIEIILCLRVDTRLQQVWEHALAFQTSADMNHPNEFIEFSWDSRSQYTASDMSSHLFAAELKAQGKLKIMVYSDSWYQKCRSISSRVCMLIFPVLPLLLCLVSMLLPDSTAESTINVAVFWVFVGAVLLRAGGSCAFFVLNATCLCIPSILLSRMGEHIEARIKSNFSANRKAPHLPAE